MCQQLRSIYDFFGRLRRLPEDELADGEAETNASEGVHSRPRRLLIVEGLRILFLDASESV